MVLWLAIGAVFEDGGCHCRGLPQHQKDIIHFYGIPEERIHVVHLGVAEHFFQAAGRPHERLIADKYFFSVTTHPTRKNIIGALKAFALFAGRCQVKYVIAGLMNETQRQELFARAGRTGLRDKINCLATRRMISLSISIAARSFFIYPSFYEGFACRWSKPWRVLSG